MSEKEDERRDRKHRKKSKERKDKRRRSRSRSRSRSDSHHRKYSRSPRHSSRNNDRSRKYSNRSQSPSRRRRRSTSRRRSLSRERRTDDSAANDPKPITLKEIISANPGISMPEAVSRLNAYNSAIARGETPPSLNGMSVSQVLTSVIPPVDGIPTPKSQREIYVGNLPPGIGVSQLTEALNAAMRQIGVMKDQNAILNVWISPDAHYAFVEFRSVEEANVALNQLNGFQVGGYSLRIGRTKGNVGSVTDSISQSAPLLGTLGSSSLPNLGSSVVSEPLSDVVMVANLPAMLDEGHIKELFTPFGELKAFNLIKSVVGQAQSAVFEFSNSTVAEAVVAGMNNLDVAGQRISVQRVPLSSAAVLLKPVKSAPRRVEEGGISCIVCLANMTTSEDLANADSYQELLEDILDECTKHSRVKSIVIPRVCPDHPDLVGKIFVVVEEEEDAKRLFQAVGGRKFNGNFVDASCYSLEDFSKQKFESRDIWKVSDEASQPMSLPTAPVTEELD